MRTIIITLMIIFCTGCGVVFGPAFRISSVVDLQNTEVQSLLDGQFRRARALLDPERLGLTLWEIPPMVSPEAIDASAGLGFYGPGTTASIYFFPHQLEHLEAVTRLKMVAPPGAITQYTSNGGLLFFGYTISNEDLLVKMASAFAGEE